MPSATKAYSPGSILALEMDNTKVIQLRKIERKVFMREGHMKPSVEYNGWHVDLYDRRLLRPLVQKLKASGFVVVDTRTAKMFSAASKAEDFVKNFDRDDSEWLTEEIQ